MTKIRLFIFIFLVTTITAFSQENIDIYTSITPQKEFNATIPLRQPRSAKEVNLPVSISWDKSTDIIKVEFKGDYTADVFLYLFQNND